VGELGLDENTCASKATTITKLMTKLVNDEKPWVCLADENDDDDERDFPARGPASVSSNEQEVQQYVRTSVTSALERARQRHSLNLEHRRRSSMMSPSLNHRGDRKRLVRQSMFSTLSLRDLNA
jgi:hypothetical protein